MKNLLKLSVITLIGVFFVSSCGPTVYSIKGNYNVVKSIETTTSYDDVWNKVVDYFAENNVAIATVEKESGIIATGMVGFPIELCAEEDKNGQISNPNAWFVAPHVPMGGNKISLTSSFNVRVRKMDNGNTYIGINVGNTTLERWVIGLLVSTKEFHKCQSTGKFEKELLSIFKKAY